MQNAKSVDVLESLAHFQKPANHCFGLHELLLIPESI